MHDTYIIIYELFDNVAAGEVHPQPQILLFD